MKVLIVDDSKIVCEGLQKMLTGIPSVDIVGQAHNGKDAITAISESKPDAVILDIRLPDLSGIEVLKDIREKNLPIKTIMLTNYPYPQYRKRCEELGADYFFDKVTEIENIYDTFKQLIEG